jgi:hypothetical protein
MILTFARCGHNAREAVRLYREQFPQRQSHSDHKTILKLIARSRETGQMQPVLREVGGAPRNVRSVEHEEAVLNVFEEDGTRSIRTVSREMGLSKSSVQRVLADNRRHPYYTRVQHLLPEDYPIRLHISCHGYCFLMSRYFAGKIVPIITTFISGQRKIQENYFPEVFNIGFLLICGLGYWAIVSQV